MRGYDNVEYVSSDPLFTFLDAKTTPFPDQKEGWDWKVYKDYIKNKGTKNDPSMGVTTEFNYPQEMPIFIHSQERKDRDSVIYWDHFHLSLQEAYSYVKAVEEWIPKEIQRRLDNYILQYDADVDKAYDDAVKKWEDGGKVGGAPVKGYHWQWDVRGLRAQFFNEIRKELNITAISPYGYSLWGWSSV